MASPILTSLPSNSKLRDEVTITRTPGSNVDIWSNSSSSEFVLAECHLATFLDFTRGKDRTPYEPSYEVAAAVALAAHQLNVGDGSIVSEVAETRNCPVKFSVEFFDTQLLEGPSLRQAIEVTTRRQRKPCAFLGAVRSAVSIPMSILTGVQGYPQLSGFSTSADLDDKNQYPLFGRTIPSDFGNAVPIILYFSQELNIEYLAVLHVNDEYGNFFAEGLRQAAKLYAPHMVIQTVDLPPPQDVTKSGIRDAIFLLRETGFNFIFGIMFGSETFDAVMEEAYLQKIAGNGHHNWFFSDSFNSALINRQIERDSPLHLAYRGVGLMEASGGIVGERLFDNFQQKLKELKNPDDLEYLSSIMPVNKTLVFEDGFMNPLKSGYISFVYEAALAVGLAACTATRYGNLTLDGYTHYEHIKATSFASMSGTVTLNNITGSREAISTLFKVVNHLEDEISSDAAMVQFKSVVTDIFQQGTWESLEDYTFNDGTSNIPKDLPALNTEQDFFDSGLRIGSWVMFAIVLVLSISCSFWTLKYQKTRVVRASQPIFLQMICAGVVIFATTIPVNMVDNSVATVRGCDIACNSVAWLLCLGFSFIFAALYTKTYRVSLILHCSVHFRRVTVTYRDVLKPMIVHLGGTWKQRCISLWLHSFCKLSHRFALAPVSANVIVLFIKTIFYPLHWEIEVENVDMFGRPTETVGRCSRDGQRLPFVIALLCINFFAMAFALLQAWKTRAMSTEYSESRYIAIVMMSIFLVAFVGGPVLVLAYDNPDASIFVGNAIVFLASCSTLLWIFVPKMKYQVQPPPERRMSSTGFFGLRSNENLFECKEEENPAGGNQIEQEYGSRVTHKRTLEQLEEEILGLQTLLSQQRQNLPSSGEKSSSKVSQNVSSVYDLEMRVTEVEDPSPAPSNGEGSANSVQLVDEKECSDAS